MYTEVLKINSQVGEILTQFPQYCDYREATLSSCSEDKICPDQALLRADTSYPG